GVGVDDAAFVVADVVAAAWVGVGEGGDVDSFPTRRSSDLVGAEAVVLGWVASAGDVGCSESVDVALEDAAVVVGEVVAAAWVGGAEGAAAEGGPRDSGDEVVGAEAVVLGWVASAGDVGCSESVDVALEDAAVVVGEVVAAAWVGGAEGAGEGGGRLSSGDGVVGAEAVAVGGVACAGD